MELTEKDFEKSSKTYSWEEEEEEKDIVVFPLKTQGKIYTTGWDIPTSYAIYTTGCDIPISYAVDSTNQCWMNSAHGDKLSKVSLSRLLNEFENEYERREFAKLMGIGMVECVCPHCNGTGKSKRIDAKY